MRHWPGVHGSAWWKAETHYACAETRKAQAEFKRKSSRGWSSS